MSMKRKGKSKIKLYIFFLLLAVCSFIFYENKKFQTRIENVYFQKKLAGENIKKTNIKNVFLINNENKYTLCFINFDGRDKKIENLKSIGSKSSNAFFDRKEIV